MLKQGNSIFIWAIAAYLSVMGGSACAQALSYGVKAGLTGSNISGQPAENVRPGLQVGGFVKLGGDEVLFVKSEFVLTHKGTLTWNINRPVNAGLYYAELPLMLGVELFKGFSLNIGFQPALLLYGHADFSGMEHGTDEGNITSALTTMDYSTLFGAEYTLSGNRLIGVRFNYGFVPIQGRQGELPFSGRNPTNLTFQIYYGYRFN